MNRIAKTNIAGISIAAIALAASSLLVLAGCGPANQQPARVVGSVPGAQGPIAFPTGPATGIGQLPAAQINALMGTYGGTIYSVGGDDSMKGQPYSIVLKAATQTAQPGQPYSGNQQGVELTFTSGNLRITSMTQVQYQPSGQGWIYVFRTYEQSVPAISEDSRVVLQLQLGLDSNNVFVPEWSAIRIADYWSAQQWTDENDPVLFNYDLSRR
jgi:hypothetical protein